tara:strand:+ start:297 stop:503 length:207 start_codon:yes stop_codon:yes gene_type:complete
MELTKEQQEIFDRDSSRVYDVFEMCHGRQALGAFWEHIDANPTWTVMELLAYLNEDDEGDEEDEEEEE